MALTGKMDTKIPRQVALLKNGIQSTLFNDDASVVDLYYDAVIPLRVLYNWYNLTTDTRVPILADRVLTRAAQNITADFSVSSGGGNTYSQ
jgi:hypothetical protein